MDGPTPDVTGVTVLSHGVLRLTFADGREGDVEVLDRMRGPVFDSARTERGFATVSVDTESGTIFWPGGVMFPRSYPASQPDQPGTGRSAATKELVEHRNGEGCVAMSRAVDHAPRDER